MAFLVATVIFVAAPALGQQVASNANAPRTKLEQALLDQGNATTANRRLIGKIDGKRDAIKKGMFPVSRDYSFMIYAVSITPPNASQPITGLEIDGELKISGGGLHQTFGRTVYVDMQEIPALQQFIDKMVAETHRAQTDPTDSSKIAYTTNGGFRLGFVRNGVKQPDFFIRTCLNPNDDVVDAIFKSQDDVAKLQAMIRQASDWLTHDPRDTSSKQGSAL